MRCFANEHLHWQRHILACLALALGTTNYCHAAPRGDELALALRVNVVRITATFESGAPKTGFGFIAGQTGSKVFIATANHLVREDAPPYKDAQRVSFEYYKDQGRSQAATLLGTYWDKPRDLALLEADAPEQQWIRKALAPSGDIQRGQRVWMIGKGDEWYVPPEGGLVASEEPDVNGLIEFGTSAVIPGSSGAPIVAERGMLGMILRDKGGSAEALSITVIKKAFETWNRPWSLELAAGGEVAIPASSPTPPQMPPTVSITASAANIERGGSVTLRWASSYASSASLNGVPVAPSGQQTVSPSRSENYEIIVRGPGGKDSDAVFVEVRSLLTCTIVVPAGATQSGSNEVYVDGESVGTIEFSPSSSDRLEFECAEGAHEFRFEIDVANFSDTCTGRFTVSRTRRTFLPVFWRFPNGGWDCRLEPR